MSNSSLLIKVRIVEKEIQTIDQRLFAFEEEIIEGFRCDEQMFVEFNTSFLTGRSDHSKISQMIGIPYREKRQFSRKVFFSIKMTFGFLFDIIPIIYCPLSESFFDLFERHFVGIEDNFVMKYTHYTIGKDIVFDIWCWSLLNAKINVRCN